jgi:hypothetical protein
MAIDALITFNGTEITEHGRTYNDSIVMNNNDFELANGNSRRFYKPSKKSFKFTWFYVPDKSSFTLDSRVGRDSIYSTCSSLALVSLGIQDSHTGYINTYTCFVSDYSETLIRNSLKTQCRYYNIALSLESVS